MKKSEVDKYILLLAAWRDGKTIEFDASGSGDWFSMDATGCGSNPSWTLPLGRYRIRPTKPALVSMADLPTPCFVRGTLSPVAWLVDAISITPGAKAGAEKLHVDRCWYRLDDLAVCGWSFSRDGKSDWKSFKKEVEC